MTFTYEQETIKSNYSNPTHVDPTWVISRRKALRRAGYTCVSISMQGDAITEQWER